MSIYKKVILAIVIIILIVLGFAYYWDYSIRHPSTDDAYVQANIIEISPRVPGKISKIHVNSFQRVKKGDVLVSIDPAEYELNKELAEIKLDLAKQNYKSLENKAEALKNQIAEKNSQLALAKKQLGRIKKLSSQNQIAEEELDKANTNVKVLESSLLQMQYGYAETKTLLGDIEDMNNNPSIREAQNFLNKQKLLLEYTKIHAPVDGIIGRVNKVNPGNMVNVGQPLFPLIQDKQNGDNHKSWWIAANFRETQMQYIKPGQKAYITLDLYPNITLEGYIADISPASGDTFSLLPAENATGNWIKVTQRFPIKIALDKMPNIEYFLRVGASANVTIDTNSK